MPLNHFMCLGFIYCLQKNKEVRPDILIDIFSAMSGKKKKQLKRNKVNFILGKCLCLAQILSLNVVLTFCGFRTLMTCVMVPVLNAGTMLLLGDRSCSWNVWWGEGGDKGHSSENTLNTMSEISTSQVRHPDDGSINQYTSH